MTGRMVAAAALTGVALVAVVLSWVRTIGRDHIDRMNRRPRP